MKKEDWIRERYKGKWEIYDYVEKKKSEGMSEEQAIDEAVKSVKEKIDKFFDDVKNIQDFEKKKELLKEICKFVDIEVRKFASEATLRRYCARLRKRKEELQNETQKEKEKIKNIYNDVRYMLHEKILFEDDSEITCYDDRIDPVLHDDFVLVPSEGAGDGGYSKRLAKRWWYVVDEGEINGKKALLFETGISSYYDGWWRGVTRRRWMVGWDDGHLFLTQVFSTCESVQEALQRLIPADVKKAQAEGKKVLRQGDLWFVKTNRKIDSVDFEQNVEIRHNHVAEKFNRQLQLATGRITHPEHGELDLSDGVYKVARNVRVSRIRSYD